MQRALDARIIDQRIDQRPVAVGEALREDFVEVSVGLVVVKREQQLLWGHGRPRNGRHAWHACQTVIPKRQSMPIYEYQCTKCGKRFEYMQKMNDPLMKKCEACGGKLERLISPAGFQ